MAVIAFRATFSWSHDITSDEFRYYFQVKHRRGMFNCPMFANQIHKLLEGTLPDLKHMNTKFFFVSSDWEFSPTETEVEDYMKWSVKNWWSTVNDCFQNFVSGRRSGEGKVAEFFAKRTWSSCLEPLNLWRWGIQKRRPDNAPPEIRYPQDNVEGVVRTSFMSTVQKNTQEKEGIQGEKIADPLTSSDPSTAILSSEEDALAVIDAEVDIAVEACQDEREKEEDTLDKIRKCLFNSTLVL